ncbi:xanthine dehydrogenase family protein subunit M [Alteribacillus sp. JSM 102045]|uniref:FAD binding domain-containing protein n=1 Tax=Alteribacillus sp. JSM 102045 TaxID=1562101 RepID=UPI0035C0D296
MKPAPFEYVVVRSINEAIEALGRNGADSRIIAGGQSLMPSMNMRQTRPAYLVDINGITDLDYIHEISSGIAIGALTRHRAVERSEVIRSVCPILQEAVKHIAHFQIRNRGTIGGSLSLNAPGAEYGVIARLLEAEMVISSPDGKRVVPADQFFVGHFKVDLKNNEILTEIRFPSLPQGAGYSFLEVTRRHGHIPIISTAAMITLDGKDQIAEIRVILGNVSEHGVPYRVKAVDRLVGQKFNVDTIEGLAKEISDEVNPNEDADTEAAFVKQFSGMTGRRVSELASAEYRKEVAGTLSTRALKIAFKRTKGGII